MVHPGAVWRRWESCGLSPGSPSTTPGPHLTPMFPGGFVGGRDDTETVIERRVALLALGSFVVASDGTLVVALLRQIASTLSVSPAAAGQAVTVFAAGYALGAPLLIRAARRAPQERLIAGTLGVFVLANAATAAAPS